MTSRAPIVRRFGFGVGEGCGVGVASGEGCGVSSGEDAGAASGVGVGVAVGVCDTAVWIEINSRIAAKNTPFDFFKKSKLFGINFQEPRINKI